jgi:hypothetical protein
LTQKSGSVIQSLEKFNKYEVVAENNLQWVQIVTTYAEGCTAAHFSIIVCCVFYTGIISWLLDGMSMWCHHGTTASCFW